MSGATRAPAPLEPAKLPVPDDALRANFGWRYYYSGEFPFSRPAVRHVRQHRIEWAAHLLGAAGGPASRRLLLDVGCGPGEGALIVARALGGFERVVGLDIDPGFGPLFAALARENGAAARYACGSCLALPAAAGSASLVISFEMLEHVPGWRGFFAEAARVLEPGGLLCASTPNPLAVHSLLKRPYARLRGFEALNRAWRRTGDFYERFIPARELRDAAAAAGLEVAAMARGGHVSTVTPEGALPLHRALEAALERRGRLEAVAATTFIVARKPRRA